MISRLRFPFNYDVDWLDGCFLLFVLPKQNAPFRLHGIHYIVDPWVSVFAGDNDASLRYFGVLAFSWPRTSDWTVKIVHDDFDYEDTPEEELEEQIPYIHREDMETFDIIVCTTLKEVFEVIPVWVVIELSDMFREVIEGIKTL